MMLGEELLLQSTSFSFLPQLKREWQKQLAVNRTGRQSVTRTSNNAMVWGSHTPLILRSAIREGTPSASFNCLLHDWFFNRRVCMAREARSTAPDSGRGRSIIFLFR